MPEQEEITTGLIVEVDLHTVEQVLTVDNLACGLVAQGAVDLLDRLHEADIASLVDFSRAKPDGVQADSVLVSAVDFPEAAKNETRQVAVQAASRHQAMEYAEQGADLLIFDAGSETGISDAAWWLEMMELACALDFRGVENLPSGQAEALADFWIVTAGQVLEGP